MQKYYITDGKNYIRQQRGGKYVTCATSTIADVYPLRRAQNILKDSLPKNMKRTFFLEGADDFERIKIEELKRERDEQQREKIYNEEILVKIEDCTKKILECNLPTKLQLLKMKGELEDAQQFYDRALSDIDHWIRNHKPAAHIRAKVYGIQHDYEVERARIKENLGFLIAIIESEERNYTYSQLQNRLKERVYKDYTPNTDVYEQLNNLLAK